MLPDSNQFLFKSTLKNFKTLKKKIFFKDTSVHLLTLYIGHGAVGRMCVCVWQVMWDGRQEIWVEAHAMGGNFRVEVWGGAYGVSDVRTFRAEEDTISHMTLGRIGKVPVVWEKSID